MSLVLSLFPGIGLLDRAFEEEGFCVVRGPDKIWGGDVRSFHPPKGVFDGVIGGPPCQRWSQLRHMVIANGYELAPNLIPEYERVVGETAPRWCVMEEVPAAPIPAIEGYLIYSELVRDVWVGGNTSRTRRISFGTRRGARLPIEVLALHRIEERQAVLAGSSRSVPVAIGGSGKRKVTADGNSTPLAELIAAQGLPAGFLDGCPLTAEGKRQAIGNGVPLAMGRAIARAVKAALAKESAA